MCPVKTTAVFYLVLMSGLLGWPLPSARAQQAPKADRTPVEGYVTSGAADSAPPAAAPSPIPPPEEACQSHCAQVPCEWLEFHGFSPDNTRLGFSILKCPGASGQGKARRFFHVRTLEGRNGRLGLKEEALRGVHFGRYFRRQGFASVLLTPTLQELTQYRAALTEQCLLTVQLLTEKTMVLEIAVVCGAQERFRSRFPLSDIYFGMAVDAYHAPDANRLFLSVHLDAQYKWDLWNGAFGFTP